MEEPGARPEVVDDAAEHRFEITLDGETALLQYRRVGKRLVLIHTEVPDALEGRGVGGQLVRAAVAVARRDGLTVVPRCPFARSWLDRHPDTAAEVTIDWPPVETRSDP
jgi:predicted GNAT family acetyltransferase